MPNVAFDEEGEEVATPACVGPAEAFLLVVREGGAYVLIVDAVELFRENPACAILSKD